VIGGTVPTHNDLYVGLKAAYTGCKIRGTYFNCLCAGEWGESQEEYLKRRRINVKPRWGNDGQNIAYGSSPRPGGGGVV